MLRIDSEDTHPISDEIVRKLYSTVEKIIDEGVDAIILEDYNKGIFSYFLPVSFSVRLFLVYLCLF